MKKITVLLMMLTFSVWVFAQQIPFEHEYKISDNLMRKSNHQKTIGEVMLVGGLGAVTIGWLTSMNNNVNAETGMEEGVLSGVELTSVGILSMAGSIPFFVLSAKNKHLARDISVGVRFEKGMKTTQGITASMYYPAIGVQLKLK